MNKKVYLHIQEPCHEDWSAMTPTQQGRHCKSCCKTVTDFSSMSDKQILGILSKAAGNSCGRFSSEQLARPIQPEITPVIKPYKIFLSAFIPAFLFAGKIQAQEKVKTEPKSNYETKKGEVQMGDTVFMPNIKRTFTGIVKLSDGLPAQGASVVIKGSNKGVASDARGNFFIETTNMHKPVLVVNYVGYQVKEIVLSEKDTKPLEIVLKVSDQVVLGGFYAENIEDNAETSPSRRVIIKGIVADEDGNPLPNATVIYKKGEKGLMTDEEGKFTIKTKRTEQNIDFTTSYTGFETVDTHIGLSDDKEQFVSIVLKRNAELYPVQVVGYGKSTCTMIAGGISVIMSHTFTDTVKTHIDKILGKALFKIYPNPVSKSHSVKLAFKNAGHYEVQLFDNSGKLYFQKEIDISGDLQVYELSLPSLLNAGKYYIKAIDTKTKKRFTDKLIVQ